MAKKEEIDFNRAGQMLKGVLIPPRPQLLLDIQEVYPDLKKIARVIETDQGVSAGVLKAINSPLYGLRKKIISIRRAVMMLGVRSVLNIVNGLLLRAALSKNIDPLEFELYWKSSNDTAIIAGAITRHLRLGSPDRSYLMGLFHNCGIPLLMAKKKNYMGILSEAYTFEKNSISRYEDDLIGSNHADIGFIVGRYWQLPIEICQVIRLHHDMRRLNFKRIGKYEEIFTLLALLKMAEHIANLSNRLGKQDIDYEWEMIKPNVLGFIGLTDESFERLFHTTLEELADYSADGIRSVS